MQEARKVYHQVFEKYPEKPESLQELINISKQNKEWQLVVDLTNIFIKYYPDLWQEYWKDSNIKNRMHLEYINALLDTGKIQNAESLASYFLINYPKSVSVHYVSILINQKRQNYRKSFDHFELSVQLTDSELVKKDLILISKTTFMTLKLYSEYEYLINSLIEKFPKRVDVL